MADVRAAEAAVMARLPEGALMARAAMGLEVECARLLRGRGRLAGSSVVVLAGAGNNGGDALYAASRLRRRGVSATAVLLAPESTHAGGLGALTRAGGREVEATSRGAVDAVRSADLVMDGIVGIGGRGALRPQAALLADIAGESLATVVAVDVPSGVDPDSGEVVGAAVRADVTVTFGCLKQGLLVGAGRRHSGEVRLVDIGLLPDLFRCGEPALVGYEDADAAALLPVPLATDTKYTRGVLGVLAGSARYPGAAVLTAGGALATGVGMVRMVSVPAVVDEVRARYPSVVCTPVADAPGSEGTVSDPAAVRSAGKVQAWVVGPGLGTTPGAMEVLRAVVAQPVPVLVDADALTLLSQEPSMLNGRPAATLLTPHDGEFARLFEPGTGGFGGSGGSDRVAAVRAAAALTGATVLLKGDATLVAQTQGPVLVNRTGTPWLASAGSGDVLSGMAGALLATGLPAQAAGAVAAHIHGLAGQRLQGASSSGLVPLVSQTVAELRRVL